MNPREPVDFPLGRWNLYIGGAGRTVPGYVNLDLFPMPGVDVAADAEQLPFRRRHLPARGMRCRAGTRARPRPVAGELCRVLAPGGYLHLVTPFCHPFHDIPGTTDASRLDGLKQLAGDLEVVAEGWRTGPTATLLVFTGVRQGPAALALVARRGALRARLAALSAALSRSPAARTGRAGRIGNHCYLWLRKRGDANIK